MQALKLVPTIHYFDTFKDFNDEFKFGKGDILVTNEWMYKPYVEGLGIDIQPILQSDRDYALNDALSLLRRECNIGP